MTPFFRPSNVDDELVKPLNEAAQHEIWESFFDNSTRQKLPESRQPYFTVLYSDEQLRLKGGFKEGSRQAEQLAIRSHRDIFAIVEVLKKNKDKKRSQTTADVKSIYQNKTEYQINCSIDLALRLAYLVNARAADERGANPSAQSLVWKTNQTLRDFFREILPSSKWKPQGRESLTRLNARFTAAFMVEICGLRLEYTSSLQEHLRLHWSEGQPVLRIFPYKACLHALATKNADPIIPKAVLNEAIRTLNLLFPISDPATEKVLMKQSRKIRFHVDEPYGGQRSLNIFDYNVWRDRLLELYDDVYQSPPASWAQLWKDDRNPQQFWTFWIALVILLLTIVSTVACIVQTVFAALAYYGLPPASS